MLKHERSVIATRERGGPAVTLTRRTIPDTCGRGERSMSPRSYTYGSVPERTHAEYMRQRDELAAQIRRCEAAQSEYMERGSRVPATVRGELMYLRARSEQIRERGMRARTREIRELGLNVVPFTYTALADADRCRERWQSRHGETGVWFEGEFGAPTHARTRELPAALLK